jgi:thioredoxin
MSILGGFGGGSGGRGAGGAGAPRGAPGPRGASAGGAAPAPAARAPAGGGAVPFVTEREFEREVLRSELPVLIEFSADWCAPCKQIAPDVEAFAREMAGKVKVVKIDVDRAPVIAQQLRVEQVPTFVLFAEQRIVDVVVGAIRKPRMQQMVDPFLPRSAGALKPVELAQLLQAGAVVPVDTREPAAFARAHLPHAKNMPLEEIESRLAELHMFAGQPVLYCRSGDKTKSLAETLAEQGAPVAFLEGGMLAWEAEGLPVERP